MLFIPMKMVHIGMIWNDFPPFPTFDGLCFELCREKIGKIIRDHTILIHNNQYYIYTWNYDISILFHHFPIFQAANPCTGPGWPEVSDVKLLDTKPGKVVEIRTWRRKFWFWRGSLMEIQFTSDLIWVWWLTYPSEKWWSEVSWDYELPNIRKV